MQEVKSKLLKQLEQSIKQLEQLKLTVEKSEQPEQLEEQVGSIYMLVDTIYNYRNKLDSFPVWTEPTEEMKQKINEPVSETKTNLDIIYDDYKKYVERFNQGNNHRQYYAWIQGGGSLLGAVADFLASLLNPNVGIGNHSARYIDAQVVEWSKTMFNFPKTSSGLLVSGSSMANVTAIITAIDYYKKIHGCKKKLRIYASKETHKCIHKALHAINGDINCLQEIKTNTRFEIDCNLLEKKINSDIEAGYTPFLLIGNFGTVNTGAIDPLDKLINIKNKYKLWLHIDGAYGAPALLTNRFKNDFELFSNVDSLAFDFHKLFNINYAAGCVLIQKHTILSDTFTVENQHYLMRDLGGIAGGLPTTDSLGFELSRDFNALKIWMIFKYKGLSSIIEMIDSRIDLARYLEQQIEKNYSSALKLISPVAPVMLSIVCFKFFKTGYSPLQLNDLNKNIVLEIQKNGRAVPSQTVINKNDRMIRISIVHYRTTKNDIDDLLNEIIETGNKLIKKIR
ncbi:MAG: pyridoxal-dependent decarboxylase [Methylobacter sp.]|nr:pyridoxal-dependent decarboxylase [Methylobacter sp.]